MVATAGDDTAYVIAGEHRYAVPRGARGQTRRCARWVSTAAPRTTVPGLWLDLITPGRAAEAVRARRRRATRPTPGSTASTPIGTPVKVDGRPYVLGQEGLLPVSAFAYSLYRSSGTGAGLPEVQVRSGEVANVRTVNDASAQPYPTDWPEEEVSALRPR